MALSERSERVLTWVLALALVASTVAVVAIALNPPEPTEPYTEFYVLGSGGNASGYPTTLSPGETGTATVGISNHEHEDVEYRVAVKWDDPTRREGANGSTRRNRTVVVADGETEEFEVKLQAPDEPGLYRVRIELYRTDAAKPYRWLQLWVTVTEERSEAVDR